MTKQRLLKVTDEQDDSVTAITDATGETYADLVRRLLALEAARFNIKWPDNMLTRDETMRKAYQARWPKEK